MAALPVIAAVAAIGGAGISAAGSIQQGNQARRLGNYQAAQLNQQAGQDQATAQRVAEGQKLQADLAASRAKTLIGAGGGKISDPTVVDILGDIQGQGEYNSMSALFNGTERANNANDQAAAARYSGNQAFQAGQIKAGSDVLNGVSTSLMAKYSPTGGAYAPVVTPSSQSGFLTNVKGYF